MVTGLVSNIQRFSLQDGPGIRTTVFFKGCNMRCSWCHNPETLSGRPEILFYKTKCIGCGRCFDACPAGAQQLSAGMHTVDREKCIGCGKCADVCFAGAMTLCGTPMTVDAIMEEILQDRAYYTQSGGGVTLSGGEVLCQKDFAAALLAACKKAGIHTAIETNLSLPMEKWEALLAQTDLVMCDLKLADDGAHRHFTGIGNGETLQNLHRLEERGIPFILRTPLIPGATATAENIAAIGSIAKTLPHLVRWELLNFNPLGGAKYEALATADAFGGARPLTKEALDELKAAAGMPVKVV